MIDDPLALFGPNGAVWPSTSADDETRIHFGTFSKVARVATWWGRAS